MTTPLYPLSERELDRADIIQRFIRREITRRHAASLLSYTERHVMRLARAVERHGVQALAHQSRGQPSNNSLPYEERDLLIDILKTSYPDFGPTLAAEHLRDDHHIIRDPKTIRQLMIDAELWQAKKKRS